MCYTKYVGRLSWESCPIFVWILLRCCLLFVWIWSLLVGQTKKVVNTDMIESRQGNKNLRRNHALTTFVVSVGSLGNIDLFSNLSLREARIFS